MLQHPTGARRDPAHSREIIVFVGRLARRHRHGQYDAAAAGPDDDEDEDEDAEPDDDLDPAVVREPDE
jgi:hypothetical protein